MKHNTIAFTLGTICCIITFLIVVQLNTIKNATGTVAQSLKENMLRNEVLKWKQMYDVAYKDLQKSSNSLQKQREKAIKNDEEDKEIETEIRKNKTLLGLTDVSGKGVIITVKDSVIDDQILDVNSGYDKALIQIVYELKNAGAEAISINEQRVINTTSIVCDGNVVQINGKKISFPFIIKTIGLQENFIGAYQRPGGYIEYLNNWGIITNIDKSNNITIPKYNGVINYKYLKSI